MELLKLSMAMNKFYNNLQDREKKLLLGAIVLIFLFVVFIYVKGTYDKYNISKKNLIKAKYDYEYVYKKVSNLKLSIDKTSISKNNINLIIKKNNLINAISELSINQENELIQITFKADTISSAITFTESIINNTESKINKINYKNYNESIGVTLVFNS
jgi:type II secretory pathway component PulM|tara:strand:+ start:1331 stop:1807 length:477 start_codon:yes stop_codon:yes gene_type:complete